MFCLKEGYVMLLGHPCWVSVADPIAWFHVPSKALSMGDSFMIVKRGKGRKVQLSTFL